MTALCAGQATAESDIWYSDTPADVELAKRACGRCLLRLSCYAGAITRGEQHGIWGGVDFTPREADELTAEMAEGFLRAEVRGDVHGKRGTYTGGCHCDDCTAANTAYMAEYERPAPVTARETMSVVEQLVLEGMPA